MFLILMVVGLVGLTMMAVPALARHGHGHAAHGHVGSMGPAGLGHGLKASPAVAHHAAPTHAAVPAKASSQTAILVDPAPEKKLRLLPSPRAVFSVLALYGAFGNALVHAGHYSVLVSALGALPPALLVERVLVRRLFSLLFRFQAAPSSPLETLLFAEARAVVPFRNGRGIISVERDGRLVQFSARLREDQAQFPVRVGDLVRIEDVDAEFERTIVSVIPDRNPL